MPSHNIKSIIKILTLSLILLSLLAFLSTWYIFSVKTLLIQDTERQLEETAIQSSNVLKKQISGDLNVLRTLSQSLSTHNALPDSEVKNLLQKVVQSERYSRILVTDTTGNSISSDEHYPDVWSEPAFKKSLAGELAISAPFNDKINDFPIITYSVPIKIKDEVKGVVIGSKSVPLILDVFQVPFWSNHGYSYIINKEGSILFHPSTGKATTSIFDLIEANGEKNIKNFLEDIKLGKSGAKYLDVRGEKKFVGYSPIKGVNDWVIISCIPASAIFNESLTIINLTTVVSVSIIFVALNVIFYVFYIKQRSERLLHNIAFIDQLTGIYNFNKFSTLAEELLVDRTSEDYAIICFDIDKFKIVNDVLGYSFGDSLLKNIGSILHNLPLNHYLYSRMTNDHFIILMPYHNTTQIIDIIDLIEHKITHLDTNKQTNLTPVLSFGVYIVPKDETDIHAIRDKAAMAKDTIKGLHQQHYAFFDETIRTQLTRERRIDSAMSQALIHDEFKVYYQPKVDLITHAYVGSEALIRWFHPVEGFISPGEFIPIAEKTGYITEISKWVIRKVCEDLSNWQKEGLSALPVSINLSEVDLYQVDLIALLERTLKEFQIDPALIEFEITERVALNDIEYTKKIISKLKKIGVKISLDDFGTGYSSLSYLKSLPIDVLKIDKCFVDDITQDKKSRNILSSIIHLAKSLHLTVVSEGVETSEQVGILKVFQCDIVQGYVFAKPMPSQDFKNLL